MTESHALTPHRSPNELFRRYLGFLVSLFIIALGTSLSIRANLGSSPISCPPYVLSLRPGAWSMGTYVICMHVIFILLQIILLRKQFKTIQLLQLAVSLIFGVFTDLTMWMTAPLQVSGVNLWCYFLRFVTIIAGGCTLAAGICIEVRCDVLVLAGEGFPLALSKVTRRDFGSVKILTDTLLVLSGVTFMLIYFRSWHWEMIGIGTLFSMVWVGLVVKFLSPAFRYIDRFFVTRPVSPAPVPAESATTQALPLVITISREYGSGGLEIGKLLSEQLQVPLYDRELINEAASELGLTADVVASSEQNISTGTLWKLIFSGGSLPPSIHLSDDDALFVAQSRAIRRFSEGGSCIIIGRCANWVLRHHPNRLSVFVCTSSDVAADRISKREHIAHEQACERYEQVNRARANHYWQYTARHWADPRDYDLVINTANIPLPEAAQLIRTAALGLKDESKAS